MIEATLAENRRRAGTFRNEPARDFSLEASRVAMEAAIREARATLPRDCPVVIAGHSVLTNSWIVSRNPAEITQTIARSGCAEVKEADEAVAAARDGFGAWSRRPATERAQVLQKSAEWMRRRRDLLAAYEILEAGKPWREADADVVEAIDFLEFYAREAVRLSHPILLQPDVPGEKNVYEYVPLGVAAVIAPWNFPLAIPAGMVAAALAGGNAVCFKPAEQTPLMGWMLCEALYAGGRPKEALHYLPGRGEVVGARLVTHPGVDLIAFTGSREVGFHILREAGIVRPGQRMIKRVICELGGKNAIIVDSTADLDQSIPDILYSAFGYSGQKCSACSRLIVLDSIYDALIKRLAGAAATWRIGPPVKPGTDMGPVIDAQAKERIDCAVKEGGKKARLAFVGELGDWASAGNYVAPHIFVEVGRDVPVMQEEIFGPVLGVIRARDFDEAIALANSVPYGLTGGIHSRTPSRIKRATREVRVGNFYVNRPITGALVGRQPFGGFGHSGVGSKAGGLDYVKQFMLARSWSENTMRHGFAPLEPEEI